MTAVESLVLGLVQGLTEFLPVSSSGHLVLAGRALGLTMNGVAFEIWLHLATLAAVVVALRRDILVMTRSLFPGGPPDDRRRGRGLVIGVVVGTIPAVVVGLLAKDPIEAAFSSVRLVGMDLLLTAAILTLSRWFPGGNAPLTAWRALVIGVGQSLAILPGVSRSGTTLTAGLMLGLSGRESARFSFLLSLPAILGAVVLDFHELAALRHSEPAALAIGFVASLVSGYLAIKVVWRVMERGRLIAFAPYCALLGLAALLIGGTVPR